MNQTRGTWTTNDELMYLQNIGRAAGIVAAIGRFELLNRYLAAALQRKHWDGLDKKRVITAARNTIKAAG